MIIIIIMMMVGFKFFKLLIDHDGNSHGNPLGHTLDTVYQKQMKMMMMVTMMKIRS